MRRLKMLKGFTVVVVTVILMMVISVNAFAATTYIVKDGAFQNSGFINAGEVKDGTVQGPGNWTQLNLGDAEVDAPYLHVILKASGGDTAAAQIAVSDTFTFNLADLGVTLTEEYQDIVLPVQDKGITMLSWLNCMGLDGGTVIYNVKDVFLSDDSASTLAPAVVTAEETTTVDAEASTDAVSTDMAKTGSSETLSILSLIVLSGCAIAFIALKKVKKAY
jgi:hypothetical protein